MRLVLVTAECGKLFTKNTCQKFLHAKFLFSHSPSPVLSHIEMRLRNLSDVTLKFCHIRPFSLQTTFYSQDSRNIMGSVSRHKTGATIAFKPIYIILSACCILDIFDCGEKPQKFQQKCFYFNYASDN